MKAFKNFTGTVVPLDRSNVDTDAIIPKQYLKSIKRTGFGPNLFDEWRYLDVGQLGQDHSIRQKNPDFILNHERYKDAEILLARENFGCGSSREHAVWSLLDYGIKVIIASSFADIFYSNSFKNSLLPIICDVIVMDKLFEDCNSTVDYALSVDLAKLLITDPQGQEIAFMLDSGLQYRLLKGLDDISMTLSLADQIRSYENNRRQQAPWLFPETPTS